MREIKFRAWESLTSTLWQPHEIEVKFINDSHHVTVPRGDGYATYHQFENSPNPLILMQYTGLKDKNEAEIYEGDILRNVDNPFVDKLPFKVEWNEYYGAWFWRSLEGEFGTDHFYQSIASDCEVIGNIYENPEPLP